MAKWARGERGEAMSKAPWQEPRKATTQRIPASFACPEDGTREGESERGGDCARDQWHHRITCSPDPDPPLSSLSLSLSLSFSSFSVSSVRFYSRRRPRCAVLRTWGSVVEGGRLRWETLMPTSSDALIFMRMYTAESSRPPTCAEGEARADVMQAASVGVGEERREREGRWGKKATERLE